MTRGAAQIGLRTFFTCGPLIMELSITKSRIELIKTYFMFLLSRNVDDFMVITTGLFVQLGLDFKLNTKIGLDTTHHPPPPHTFRPLPGLLGG